MSPVGYLGRPCMWGGADPCPPASWLGVWAPGEWLWGKSSKDRVPLGRHNSKGMCRAGTAWGVRREVPDGPAEELPFGSCQLCVTKSV